MNRYKRQQGMPVTFTLIFLMVLTFILQKTNPQMFMKFFALKSGFADFYAWQFITYIFLDNISGFSFFFKALIVFMFSSSLEMGWSSGKLLLFFALTVLPKSIIAAAFAFFIPGNLPLELILNGTDGLLNPNSLFLSLMIAYGFLHREGSNLSFLCHPYKDSDIINHFNNFRSNRNIRNFSYTRTTIEYNTDNNSAFRLLGNSDILQTDIPPCKYKQKIQNIQEANDQAGQSCTGRNSKSTGRDY